MEANKRTLISKVNSRERSDTVNLCINELMSFIQQYKDSNDRIDHLQTGNKHRFTLTYGSGQINRGLKNDILNEFQEYHLAYVNTIDAPLRDVFELDNDYIIRYSRPGPMRYIVTIAIYILVAFLIYVIIRTVSLVFFY